MIRRRLAAYTAMYTAGISAGYFILEKERPLIAALFLISLGAAVCLLDIARERVALITFMLMGFILITFTYIDLERREAEVITGEDVRFEISGRVLSAQKKHEYTKLIIKTDEGTRVIANIRDEADIVKISGAIVKISGRADELSPSDNPGCFDYKIYMRSKGIAYGIKADWFEIEEDGNEVYWRLRRYLISAREDFLSHFDTESSGFIRGLVFGDKSEINEEIHREFNLNSTGHILAVSGLHIGFLYSLLKLLSGRDKSRSASLIIIAVMTLYGEMTEWSASTLRAVIVLGLSLLSVNFKRTFDLLSSLSAAALIILIIRPYMLFNAGFQMSFAAMGGIAFLGKQLCGYFGKLIGTTLSVQIGTIPVIATTYYRVNIIAALINIPIIMLSSLLVPLCLFMLFFRILTGLIPSFAVFLIQISSKLLISLNHSLSFEGGFSNTVAGIASSSVIITYIILILISSEWMRVRLIRRDYKRIGMLIILGILPICLMCSALFDSFKDDEIVFVAVGQGDSVHIRCEDNDVMIDGGGSEFTNTGERILMPYLLSQGASDLDIAILTHLHKDHYLGISELCEEYKVRSVAMPEDYRISFEKALNDRDIPELSNEKANLPISFNCNQMIYLNNQSEIRLSDEVYVEVIWPNYSKRHSSHRSIDINDPNEHNMVYMIRYGAVKVMVTGDLLEEDEHEMVKHYKGSDKLRCDILKVAHHGSKSSSSEEFLDAAAPKIAVIQVGRNNLYGHPHAQTLERLEERGIKVYRTDTDGAVGVDISKNGGSIKVHRMH